MLGMTIIVSAFKNNLIKQDYIKSHKYTRQLYLSTPTKMSHEYGNLSE